MRAKSKWHGLDFIVQWRAPGWPEYKPVAAFYDRGAAIRFAEESKTVNGLSSYRVVRFKNTEPTLIWRSIDRSPEVSKMLHETIIG